MRSLVAAWEQKNTDVQKRGFLLATNNLALTYIAHWRKGGECSDLRRRFICLRVEFHQMSFNKAQGPRPSHLIKRARAGPVRGGVAVGPSLATAKGRSRVFLSWAIGVFQDLPSLSNTGRRGIQSFIWVGRFFYPPPLAKGAPKATSRDSGPSRARNEC